MWTRLRVPEWRDGYEPVGYRGFRALFSYLLKKLGL